MNKAEKEILLNTYKSLLIADREGFDKKDQISTFIHMFRSLNMVKDRTIVENELYIETNNISKSKINVFNSLLNMIYKHTNYTIKFDFDDIDFILNETIAYKDDIEQDTKNAMIGSVKYLFDLNEYKLERSC